MSRYREDLAWELQLRNVPEPNIREALAEVREVESAGESPFESFGSPKEYAATFTGQPPAKVVGRGWVTAGGCAALLWVVGLLLYVKYRDVDLGNALDVLALLPALGFLLAGVGLGFLRARSRARQLARG